MPKSVTWYLGVAWARETIAPSTTTVQMSVRIGRMVRDISILLLRLRPRCRRRNGDDLVRFHEQVYSVYKTETSEHSSKVWACPSRCRPIATGSFRGCCAICVRKPL